MPANSRPSSRRADLQSAVLRLQHPPFRDLRRLESRHAQEHADRRRGVEMRTHCAMRVARGRSDGNGSQHGREVIVYEGHGGQQELFAE